MYHWIDNPATAPKNMAAPGEAQEERRLASHLTKKGYTQNMNKNQEKLIRSLHTGATRKQTGLCLVEGVRAITTFSSSRHTLNELYVTDSASRQWAKELASIAIYTNVKAQIINEDAMLRISASKTPSGLAAIFKLQIPTGPLERGIVCAARADPGNVGTLIRTAAAVNRKTVVMVDGVDPFSPKVIQASAGAIALVDVFQLSWQELLSKNETLQLYALMPQGGVPPTKQHGNGLLVIGNEAHGIPANWVRDCSERLTLAMPGNTESLNAAVAGSIALYLTL